MKKFFAVVLGLALVLGVASIASAELTASGKLTMSWTVNTADDTNTYQGDMVDDTNMALKLSNEWDNASASLTLKYDADAGSAFGVDGYEFAYAFSDQFTLKVAKSFEQKTPIFDSGDDAASVGTLAFIGEFTLDNGWVKAATNADFDEDSLELALAAEFAFDPVTVGGIIDSNPDDTMDIGVYVKYALSDEITLIADVAMLEEWFDLDDDGVPETYGEAQVLALKAEYNGDPFTAAVRVDYDLEDSDADLYWKLEGSYAITDATKLSANYDQLEAYEIKLAHTINEGPVLSFAYNQDEILTAKIEAEF